MNILFIGGAGFIGYNFIKWMSENHPEISLSIFDVMNYAGSYKSEEKMKLFFKTCIGKYFNKDINVISDLTDSLLNANKIATNPVDTIVNFAAQTHVDNSLSDPKEFWKTNIQGAINVASVASDFGLRLHHVSTDEVYGSVKESDDVNENSTPTSAPADSNNDTNPSSNDSGASSGGNGPLILDMDNIPEPDDADDVW